MIAFDPDFRVAGVALLLACLVLPAAASAAPQACTVDQGRSICSVAVGDSSVGVRASSLDGGELLAIAAAGGTFQLGLQGFSVYSFDEQEFIDVTLDFATEDPVTNTITVQFTEAFSSALRATAVFTLTDLGDTTVIDQSFTFLSLLPFGFPAIGGRFYVVTDYDLNDEFINDTVTASPGGLTITQTDAGTVATQEVISPVPGGFDVALFPELSGTVLDDVFVNLQGRTTAPGPGDFQHALSWDRSLLPGASLTATLRQTITPAPEPAQPWAASLLTLAAIARARSRSSRP